MLGMVTTMDATTTGLKEIAEALGGGIREGSLVLIEGEVGAGKSVLSQYITYGILGARESSVAYYTSDGSTELLLANMDAMSLGVRHDFATDRFRIYPLAPDKAMKGAQEYLQLLLNHFSSLPGRFKLLIVDSVSPLMMRLNPMAKFDFLQLCKELCAQDRSIVLTLDTHIFEVATLSRVHAMSDYYLKLRSSDVMLASGQVDTRNIKVLEVTKLGGAERRAQEDLKFEIKPRVGIQILPLLRVKI
jgi:flagellar protein FlaH